LRKRDAVKTRAKVFLGNNYKRPVKARDRRFKDMARPRTDVEVTVKTGSGGFHRKFGGAAGYG